MAIKSSGQLSFTDIEDEFGQASPKRSISAYRISENLGSLTNLPIDKGVPGPGSSIKFSDFYGKKLNIVLYYTNNNIGSPGVPVIDYTAKTDFDSNNTSRVRVLGGLQSLPLDPTGTKIIININRIFGAAPAITGGNPVRGDIANDTNRTRCAFKTGNWSAQRPAEMVIEVGPSGEIYGAGGDGGAVTSAQAPNPVPTQYHGQNGTSAIGIGYTSTIVNKGYIQCGFGGGGAGSYQLWTAARAGHAAGGGGGGGGAGCRTGRIVGTTTVYTSFGGDATAYTPLRRGSDGDSGSNGTFRIGGSGGSGGTDRGLLVVAGYGGTGGYSSGSVTGWAIKYGKFTSKRALYNAAPQTGITTVEGTPRGLFFHPNGLYFYIIGSSGASSDFISRYTCVNNPWDIHTARWDGPTKNKVVGTENAEPRGMFIRSNGTTMWMVGTSNNRVYQYNLSTPWDVSTAVSAGFYVVPQVGVTQLLSNIQDIWWKPDGSSFYLCGLNGGNASIAQFNASSTWNVLTGITTGSLFRVNNIDNDITSLCFKPDGKKMYVLGNDTDSVYEFDLNTAWTVNQTNITPTNSGANQNTNRLFVGFSLQGYRDTGNTPDGDGSPQGMFIRQDDGEILYMVGDGNNILSQYSITAQSGEAGEPSDVLGGFSGYPGYAFVLGTGSTITIDPSSTGTLIGISTSDTIR